VFDWCARSILVCQGSIVATFLADVLCAAGGDLCGWFTSVTIRKSSSPGHDKTTAENANRKEGTKAKCSSTESRQE
jgi:hypothetical protein